MRKSNQINTSKKQSNRKLTLLLFAGLLLSLVGCKEKEDPVMKDFMAFYKTFHQDSTFQKEHIIFPLEGLPSGADTLLARGEKFYWKKENWAIHEPFDFKGSEFSQEFKIFNDDLVAEYVIHNSESYGMVRRFARYDDEWFLIYYAASNRLKPKPQIFIE